MNCKKIKIGLAAGLVMTTLLPAILMADTAPKSDQVVAEAAKVVPAGKTRVVDSIAIKIGNEIITTSDIEIPLNQLELYLKKQYRGQELKEKLDTAREQHIKKLVEGKLLLLEARRQEIEVQDTLVKETAEKEIENLRQQFPSEEAFKKQLAREHLNEYELTREREKMVKDTMMRQRLLQQKLHEFKSGAEVSDDKLKEYYDQHKEEFHSSPRAHVQQIYVKRPDAGLSTSEFIKLDDLAKQKINNAYKEIKRGRAFDAVAKSFSEHKLSAEKGGDIGWIEKGDIGLPEFEKAVFETTAPGTVSAVLDTARGYFLIKVLDRQPGTTLPYNEVKGRIRQSFMAEGSEKRYANWIESLKEKYKVDYVKQ